MTRAAVRERAQARRAADAAFREAFDAYMFECFAKPGFKLESEAQLAERFGVTRYKVRKAIEALNQAGVLERVKHGGSTVRSGLWREYVGGYSDWLQQRPEPVEPAAPAAPQPKAAAKPRPRDNKIRMSYKETQELERLPKLIEDLEAEQAALMEAMSAPDYHTKSVEELRKDAERAKAIEDEIASSYERWEALEEKRQLAENQ